MLFWILPVDQIDLDLSIVPKARTQLLFAQAVGRKEAQRFFLSGLKIGLSHGLRAIQPDAGLIGFAKQCNGVVVGGET